MPLFIYIADVTALGAYMVGMDLPGNDYSVTPQNYTVCCVCTTAFIVLLIVVVLYRIHTHVRLHVMLTRSARPGRLLCLEALAANGTACVM